LLAGEQAVVADADVGIWATFRHSSSEKLLNMILDHCHRYEEGLSINCDGHRLSVYAIGTCYTIPGKSTGTLVAVELNVILCGYLLCSVNELHRITLKRKTEGRGHAVVGCG